MPKRRPLTDEELLSTPYRERRTNLFELYLEPYDFEFYKVCARKRGVPLSEFILDAMRYQALTEENPRKRVTSKEIHVLRAKFPRARS